MLDGAWINIARGRALKSPPRSLLLHRREPGSTFEITSSVVSIGLDPAAYGTHSIRRTKPSLIYRRTKNLRAVQLLLGHTKLESTVRYLGIEVEDALELAEQRGVTLPRLSRIDREWRSLIRLTLALGGRSAQEPDDLGLADVPAEVPVAKWCFCRSKRSR
jgi:hypothetical protein